MSMKDCLGKKAKDGKIDGDKAKEAEAIFDEELAARGNEDAAAQATIDRLSFDKAERQRRALLQIQTQQSIQQALRNSKNMAETAIGVIDHTGIEDFPLLSAKARRNVSLGIMHSKMTDLIAHHKRNLAGRTRDKAGVLDIVREAFGEPSGNANARAFNLAWQEAAEWGRTHFNASGGHIGKHERWGLPTLWDVVKMRVAGGDEFIKDAMPRLDWEKIEARTGRAFPVGAREDVLRNVWETIKTNGASKLEPSSVKFGRTTANRRADHRFMEFKSADDWIFMQQKYGNEDAFSVMIGYIESMARDIGDMQALGPNPVATVRYMQSVLRKEADTANISRAKANKLRAVAEHLTALHDVYTGSVNRPANEMWATGLSTTRGTLTAAQLGGAQISAITDPVFNSITKEFNGLPQTRELKRFLTIFVRASREDQKFAVRAGLVADNWTQVASAQMRYIGEIPMKQWAQTVSDSVLRASLLSHWTQAGRWSFGLEFAATLADNIGKQFDELDSPLRRAFERYNISADDWNIIRKTPLEEYKGVDFLRPVDIEDENLLTKVLTMFQTESDFAVPTASIRGRAALGGSARPGTLPGEMIRSGLMYKSFAITMYQTHIRRGLQRPSMGGKFGYLSSLVVATTLMGAMALQLKEISRGKGPRDWNDPKFWIAALVQGGGLGIFGDFLFSDWSRFGQSIGATVAGPVVGFATDMSRFLQKVVKSIAQGKNKFGGDIPRIIGRYTPGTSLWYARLVFERYILDQLQKLIDPDYRKRWRTQERNRKREMNQRFWWPRGELRPAA